MEMNTFLKFLIAVSGAAASYLFGGWTQLLSILLTFVVIDYASGFAAAWKEGALDSEIGRDGIMRKVMIFGIVAVAQLVDSVLGDSHILRDMAILFYITNELLSLIENAGRLGVPIPPALTKAVQVLIEKAGNEENKS